MINPINRFSAICNGKSTIKPIRMKPHPENYFMKPSPLSKGYVPQNNNLLQRVLKFFKNLV